MKIYSLHINIFVCDEISRFFFIFRHSPQWNRASSFTRFLDHTTTHHSRKASSGRVISSSQRPLPDNTQHSRQTSIPLDGIRTHNLSRREAADLRLRPRGHWDLQISSFIFNKYHSSYGQH
jgi:hypothetical protein